MSIDSDQVGGFSASQGQLFFPSSSFLCFFSSLLPCRLSHPAAPPAAQVNTLIAKYLQESGFTHSAFVFKAEAAVKEESLGEGDERRGVLVSFLQKGLIYSEIETHISAVSRGRFFLPSCGFLLTSQWPKKIRTARR